MKIEPTHVTEECLAVREVLARVGDKWSVLTVSTLQHGPKRFNELRRGIDGISQRMLTLTLRALERDGLVHRTVFATVPPRVDYGLTDVGRSLLGPVLSLESWARENRARIRAARQRFDGVRPTAEHPGASYATGENAAASDPG